LQRGNTGQSFSTGIGKERKHNNFPITEGKRSSKPIERRRNIAKKQAKITHKWGVMP